MIRITNKEIIFGITGTIYEMHPYHSPEGIDKIMEAVNKWLDEKVDVSGEIYTTFKIFSYDNFNTFEKELRTILMGILEFRQLNISRKLKDAGVNDINDERNNGIVFSSRYDSDTKDKRYSDFIDLDACIRNICTVIDRTNMNNQDCFLCKYAKEYGSMKPSDCEQCETCFLNPSYTFNHECHPMSIKPKKDWTEEEKKEYEIF